MNSCTALVLYSPPFSPEEFIMREVEKYLFKSSLFKALPLPVSETSLAFKVNEVFKASTNPCTAIVPYKVSVSPREFLRQKVEKYNETQLNQSLVVFLSSYYATAKLSRCFIPYRGTFRIIDEAVQEDNLGLGCTGRAGSMLSATNTTIAREKVEKVRRDITNAVVDALSTIMLNKKTEFAGVWYPKDLNEYFAQKSEEMPKEYWTGYAASEYFHKMGIFTFELKEGKSASDAVNILLVGPSVLDCGNATQLAYYKAILDVVGSEKFDALFSSGSFKLKISQNGITDWNSPISRFSDYTAASKKGLSGDVGKRPLSIGEECHFRGVKYYANKHPTGSAGGWNVINIGDNQFGEQLFVAHGFESPMTEKEINKLLVELYNRERTKEDIQYISENPKPSLYGKNVNYFLRRFYTVPADLKDSMVDGFLVGSCRGIKYELVARVLEEEIDERFHLVLIKEKLASLM